MDVSPTVTDDIRDSILRVDVDTPGLVVFFSGEGPACMPIPLGDEPVVFGRAPAEGVVVIDDHRISRRQTRISRVAEGFRITDLGSRNGTFVDGQRVHDELRRAPPRVLRMGHTLVCFTPNIALFLMEGVQRGEGGVMGPTLRESRRQIERAAAASGAALLTGPSGAGKELAARAFHAATKRKGPFVAVNCAAIPTGLAERLLFGARRGAYSGAAADAEGYAQAADGGTLFLDEIAELDLSVQPKLLRMLEEKEVIELGASRPRKVDVRVCAATLKDLRAEVAKGRFREDLYYRIGRPEVRIPSLIERIEEMPYLVQAELEGIDARLSPSALFLEAAALRPWPGNVREFLLEVRQSARVALDAGRTVLETADLSPTAGQALALETKVKTTSNLSRETIEAALRREKGNVTGAARALGLHRNQLRRWLGREGLDPTAFGDGAEDKSPESA